ncbi:MAG: hypothetical protein ABS938_19125, partial [Psychrobacillus psychrodurans]
DNQLEKAIEYKKEVDKKLQLSDKVVNGDLLRFYTPAGFSKVNPSEFNYNQGVTEETDNEEK